MSLHLQRFAKLNIEGKPRGYLIALAMVCKGVGSKGRLSEQIKEQLSALGPNILKFNIDRRRKYYSEFLAKLSKPVENSAVFGKGIEALRVKNFRGFGNSLEDDSGSLIRFNPRKNIFFAPNGGGKTSLCEALEFVFTGGIKEADRRRTKITEYVRRNSEKPIVRVRLSDGEKFSGTVSIDSCFIDRNRLQEFSLLGSKDTNFQERDVLATLFGLEEIEELLGRFVLPKSFVLATIKRSSAKAEMDRLVESYNLARDVKDNALTDISNCRSIIASNLGINKYQRDLVSYRLEFKKKYLEFKREKLTSRKLAELPIEFSSRIISVFKKRIERSINIYQTAQRDVLSELDGVSFEELFKALLDDPNADTADVCPACLTPLSEVTVNPYKRAAEELKKLSRLADARTRLREAGLDVKRYDAKSKFLIDLVTLNSQRGVQAGAQIIELVDLLRQVGDATLAEKQLLWGKLFEQCEKVAEEVSAYELSCTSAINPKLRNADEEAKKIIARLEMEVEDISFQMRTIKEKRKCIIQVAPKLASFRSESANVRRKLSVEDEYNNLVDEVEVEYKNLLEDLRRYKLDVEDSQISGIEEKAVDFYKKINHGDDECEQVVGLKFVRSDTGYRIELELLGSARSDAFSCLSEGHLRALGLSLLLAVAKNKKYPFIIFDDVVNAIDSDHRANIISLLHEDDYLSSTQQIITTHDRLFWERYCNACKAKFGPDALSTRTLRNTNLGIVTLEHAGGFKSKIQHALEHFDVRQALIYCRIWFETLVVDYCTNNNLTVTASFSNRQLKPGNYLTISLESTYNLLSEYLSWDLSNVNILRTDLINWQAQNQEHHAFDESSLNFVHAKTSSEVKKIFDALVRFSYQLSPEENKVEITREKLALEKRLVSLRAQLGNEAFISKAPAHVVAEYRDNAEAIPGRIGALDTDLLYLEQCVARR